MLKQFNPPVCWTKSTRLTNALDNYLSERNKGPSKRKKDVYHPSEISKCPRQFLFKVILDNEFIPTISSRTLRIFEVGHGVHNQFQYLLRKSKIWQDINNGKEPVAKDDELNIYGRCDGVVVIGDHNEQTCLNALFPENSEGLEIKSDGRAFPKRKNPELDHLIQFHIYMHCLKLKKGFMFYVYKLDADIKEYEVTFNDWYFQQAIDNIIDFERAMNIKQLPERKCEKPHGVCEYSKYAFAKWCDFTEICMKHDTWTPRFSELCKEEYR